MKTLSSQLIYKRIILKISGELLTGNQNFGIDVTILKNLAQDIKKIVKLGVEISIVIGGGNLFRGESLEKNGIKRVFGDHIGMLSTLINGLAIYDIFNAYDINVFLMSAIPYNNVCETYNCIKAIKLLNDKNVLVLSGGIGNPFFTTDSTACLRAIELEADVVIKATKVDGVFSNDPVKKKSNTFFYKKLSYQKALDLNLKVMDLTAFILARDYCMPIIIFNMYKPEVLYKILIGEKEGTLITN
ncbi:UMP kinase [Candidatus Tachikawaea gelatinosa]|uniref:Uridylate kinase n=1 Tax=Candidatus Tachikawaea gelatinosa TaxID=1410383 RepID=A0A090ARI4_9ENTR|nr:UMP kinase [Candidatus Tachikawaea gelatinosa]BAP58395.1 uridylate kinase [Candidatus Tachikawaea gelatinosa]